MPTSKTSLLSKDAMTENSLIEVSPHPPPYNNRKSNKTSKTSKTYKTCKTDMNRTRKRSKSDSKRKSKKTSNRFAGLKRSECIQKLKELKILQSIWVHENKYDRWTMAHLTMKRLNVATDLHVECTDNKGGMLLYV